MMAKIPNANNDGPIDRDPFVQSLARGLSIIKCFDADNSVMTLTQIAERVSLSRAAARQNEKLRDQILMTSSVITSQNINWNQPKVASTR